MDDGRLDALGQTIVSALPGAAIDHKVVFNQLTVAEFQSISPAFGRDTLGVFDLSRAMAKRTMIGAPGTKEVKKQLARWREQLSI